MGCHSSLEALHIRVVLLHHRSQLPHGERVGVLAVIGNPLLISLHGAQHIQLGKLTLHAKCWVEEPTQLAHLAPYADTDANGHAIDVRAVIHLHLQVQVVSAEAVNSNRHMQTQGCRCKPSPSHR